MNITSPIMAGAARVAELPGDSTSFLKLAGTSVGLFNDSPDAGLSIAMSALAGVAAALAVTILLSIYFSGYRTPRDVMKHGLAATAILGFLAFAIHDVGHAALAYLGINPSKPAVEFQILVPKAAHTTAADAASPGTHDFAIRYRIS